MLLTPAAPRRTDKVCRADCGAQHYNRDFCMLSGNTYAPKKRKTRVKRELPIQERQEVSKEKNNRIPQSSSDGRCENHT